MFTKNIIFKNFIGKKNKKQNFFLNNILKKKNLFKEYPFLESKVKLLDVLGVLGSLYLYLRIANFLILRYSTSLINRY